MPLFAPSKTRPQPANPAAGLNLLRAALPLSSWLALGALAQLLLFALPFRRIYTVTPALLLLLAEFGGRALMAQGWIANSYAADAIKQKVTTLIPTNEGEDPTTRNDKVCVFMLGFRNNHPLGLLAPGFSDINKHASAMMGELDSDEGARKFGFLGQSQYLEASQHTAMPQILTIQYFRSMAALQAYAASPKHAEAMRWFNSVTKKYPHLGIMHESYETDVGTGQWETIYLNHHPVLFSRTQHWVSDDKGEGHWESPMVTAKEGRLASAAGRLAKAKA